jgi:cold shock CspA family protein
VASVKGRVLSFDAVRGGFIRGDNGRPLFVAANQVAGVSLRAGREVLYEEIRGPKGFRAVNVRPYVYPGRREWREFHARRRAARQAARRRAQLARKLDRALARWTIGGADARADVCAPAAVLR